MALNHIKPHGALYAFAAHDEAVTGAILDAADAFGAPLYGLAGTVCEQVYGSLSLLFVAGFYADLNCTAEGPIIITREYGTIDPAAKAKVARGHRRPSYNDRWCRVRRSHRQRVRPLRYTRRRRGGRGSAQNL